MCGDDYQDDNQEETRPTVASVDELMAMDDEQEAIAEVTRLIHAAAERDAYKRTALEAIGRETELRRHVAYWQQRALDAERGESKLCDDVAEWKARHAELEQTLALRRDGWADMVLSLPRGVTVTFSTRPDGSLHVVAAKRDAHNEVTESSVLSEQTVRASRFPDRSIVMQVQRLVTGVRNAWRVMHGGHEFGGEGG